MERAYAALESRIGYEFAEIGRLESALTHKSYLNENPNLGRGDNQRMEFLGDAVLGLAVAHLLMETHPERSEGELTRVRAQIVSEAGLSEVALAIGLGEWLFLGRGAEQLGGRTLPSVLADACEALIAAVYIDAGFDRALDVVRRLFGDRVRGLDGAGSSDFKSRLQELAQGRLKAPLKYAVLASPSAEQGNQFDVAVLLGEREVARGQGRSKKEAEQRAAERALAILDAESV